MKILDIPRSGSIAGTTSSHNRAGQYVRNRRTPTNNPTARRTAVRSAFASASSAYSALTPTQQASWVAAADAHPITDALGQSIKLSGHQLYVAINTALLNANSVSTSTPPPDFSVYSQTGAEALFSLATGLTITLSGLGSASDFALVALSKPLPGGRSFNKTFTQVIVDAGNATTQNFTTAVYSAQFGTPVIGQKVFVKVTPVNQYGVTGVPVIFAAVVTA